MTERSIRVPPWSLNRDLGGCHRCFAEAAVSEPPPQPEANSTSAKTGAHNLTQFMASTLQADR